MTAKRTPDYIPLIKDDHVIIARIFHYLGNYLYGFNEHDHLDMDFIVSILNFLDTFLIPIYFGLEEQVLFKQISSLAPTPKMLSMIEDTTRCHRSIEHLSVDLAFLKTQYDKGYYSSINEIHITLGILLKMYKDLAVEQNELFPKIEQFLTTAQKETLNSNLLEFNESIIKHVIHHAIIERYKKYNSVHKKQPTK